MDDQNAPRSDSGVGLALLVVLVLMFVGGFAWYRQREKAKSQARQAERLRVLQAEFEVRNFGKPGKPAEAP